MKPVDMQFEGSVGDGDCLMACLASICECALGELPRITRENDAWWWRIFYDAARSRGFVVREFANDPNPCRPVGYSIAIGQSPRFGGAEAHAVVALDGDIVHDPHSSRAGIARVDYWISLMPEVPTAPSPVAGDAPTTEEGR